ncbi:MAG TPA: M20 family peptidase [Candidatus Caldiarchaeum subterraneum]|uniref:M20 family peptidase n=1 Tax=Caldiarchaeum subterraneum TaxID=311458 RepID=A0A833ECT0_CALS0|nr:M20 family peptidase [Candidatus Caldarchaeum subterraneum]
MATVSSQEILAKIDAEKTVQRTMDLANVASPTGQEGDVAQVYKEMLEAVGMRVTLQEVEPGRYNVVGVLRGSGGGASLMFNGHLDTSFSPTDDPEILKAISPVYRFEPPWSYREGEWLYGMGVFNMKGALAAYVSAVEALQNTGAELKGDIMIAGVVGEIEKTQIDQYKGAQYRGYGYGTAYLVTHGGVTDYAILGEPTGLRLMLAHFGSVWAKISLKGKLVHTAHAGGMNNLIIQMTKIIDAIQEWIPDYQNRYQYQGVKPIVNIGSIEGGWPWRCSRTPWFCNLYIDVRYPPRRSPVDVKEELETVLKKVEQRYGVKADLEIYVSDAWAEVEEGEYVVKALDKAHEKVFNQPLERVVFSWSSDANVLTRNGVVAVNYGPSGGPGKETRGTLHIPSLVSCTKVYALAAYDICNKERREARRRFTITYE